MQRIKNYLVALSIVTIGLFPMATSAQLPDYPPEFSPLRTSRPAKPQLSLVPPTKFVKVQNAIPNRYIVVLNDDVVPNNATVEVRRANITALANSHAQAHLGTVGYVYATALKGYSIELPNEAAAIAISHNPQVKWVEEVGRIQPMQEPDSFQPHPPWGLDAIDGSIPVGTVFADGTTNGIYIYNGTGSGVVAFVLDTGLRRTHQEFAFRAPSGGADFITYANGHDGPSSPYIDSCVDPTKPNANDNDCSGHGTHVAGTLGGSTYGAAKGVTILSVKVCTNNFYGCPTDVVNAGIDWVTNYHSIVPNVPVVANVSLGGDSRLVGGFVYDNAATNSINSGVTYVISAGNSDDDAKYFTPADVPSAITVGASDFNQSRAAFPQGGASNVGSVVDLFAPGYFVLSAYSSSDTATAVGYGTSQAAPHVAGAVAMYLEGRTGTLYCPPIQDPASATGSSISTCPDRVARFIDANANLNRLSNVNGVDQSTGLPVTSPNRFLYTGSIPTRINPLDNQRFFVWQQYADFLSGPPFNQPVPDENGLNFWTGNITGTCSTGFNDNNSCTHTKRIDVSRAFWVAAYGSLFNSNGTTNNSDFLHLCYSVYLRRRVPDNDPGFQYWLGNLSDNYGNPANYNGVNHLIDAFLTSTEYRQRFGQP